MTLSKSKLHHKNRDYMGLIEDKSGELSEDLNQKKGVNGHFRDALMNKASINYHCQFQCYFDQKNIKDIEKARKAKKQLLFAAVFCFIFMIGEFTGGLFAGSLALMSDALHLFSDLAGLIISAFAIWMTEKKSTDKLSFGYYRAEIVGALFSVFLIWGLTVWLVFEAIQRILHPQSVNGKIMFIVAIAGIVVNIVMGAILHQGGHHHHHGLPGADHHHHGDDHHHHHHKLPSDSVNIQLEIDTAHVHHQCSHEHTHDHSHDHSHGEEVGIHDKSNINVRSAFIHVLGDLLQSIGVLIAASLIWANEDMFRVADPICTLIFSIIVMFTTVNLLRDILKVLMESVPDAVNLSEIKQELKTICDVANVHDLHVWNLSLGKPALSVHLVVESSTIDENGRVVPACLDAVLHAAQQLILDKFEIDHSTIQIEWPHETRTVEESKVSCPEYCEYESEVMLASNSSSCSINS